MTQMEMIPCFTDVLHVPNLSTAEHLMAVIKKSGVGNTGNICHVKIFTVFLKITPLFQTNPNHTAIWI